MEESERETETHRKRKKERQVEMEGTSEPFYTIRKEKERNPALFYATQCIMM